ncbi:MFS transporter [Flavivirga spongiicola]|uniref:MFS transporter n=1 Tax=Flavivirga spongiicola TaxID=421621 RepID=A0ABU7XW83_9FLAO|nr:MFS transporter [Flavivirga sp. MEBiC05379]MDO5980048.1 MFS transporter [Flavivirga sp. MEBiC05379]
MNSKHLIVGLVLLVFFVISLLTNILGALNPGIKESFNLEFSSLGFMTLAFFSAYGIMSIPSGILLEKYKEKKMMLLAFSLATIGAFSFAVFPTFPVFLFSLFLIGTGMAMLQVAINPLLREAGGEEHFAFYSVMGQLFFGAAGVVGPFLFTYLVQNIGKNNASDKFISFISSLIPSDMSWVSIYWVFGAIALLMVIVITLFKFPKVELKEDEKPADLSLLKSLFKNKTVLAFFIGIFCYVGFEQGVSFWISQFLETYHGVDPNTEGAASVGHFWGLLTLGCLLGLVLLKFIDSKKVLLIFSSLAFISLSLALFGSKNMALLAFPAVGFFASVMWSIIFSLALNSVKAHHGSIAGILCTGIVGGAIAPFIVGGLSDLFGLKAGMFFNYIMLAYILSIGIWANPLVKNKTLKTKKDTMKSTSDDIIEFKSLN